MEYNIYHIKYGIGDEFWSERRNAVVSASSQERAQELLGEHLCKEYVRKINPKEIGFSVKNVRTAKTKASLEEVILPSEGMNVIDIDIAILKHERLTESAFYR